MIKEFKEFIMRGNVIDLAVGVIVGAAFQKIVSSLVDNILMPIVGMIIGGIDFTSLSVMVGTAEIKYGLFIQNVIDFLIVAFVLFLVVKAMNSAKKAAEKKLKKEEKKAEEEAPAKSEDIVLLEEIRDLLASNKKTAKK
ncbi:MAG: large-conductance mechanosensitive channel protein MscL [Bacilli bacterium]|nr:large-conductance mechanosensitive channel protein MscL [Bacilli bacterium]MBR1817612.1 large-conductance mechanosensitive channel protein MscL [Bacilli bacterium]